MKKKYNVKEDYLKTLERVKKQYQEYIEVSGLYDLPTAQNKEEINSAGAYDYPVITTTKILKDGIVE